MKVSIITPTLNPLPCYLSECINSIQSQKSNTEHIFIDGISKNGSLQFLIKYQELFPDKIKVICEQDNNVYEAWNKGILISTGDILGWLGADDTSPEGAIKTVIEYFEMYPEASVLYGDCNVIDEKGKMISRVYAYDFNLKKAINEACPLYTPAVFFRREVVDKIGLLDISMPSSEFDFYLRAAKEFKFQRIDRVLANFRLHEGGATGKNGATFMYAKNNYIVAKKYGASIFSPRGRNYLLMWITRPIHPVLFTCMNNKIIKKVISFFYYKVIGHQGKVIYFN